MLHPIYNEVKDRLFQNDPVLKKLVERIKGEDNDQKDQDREVSQRD